MSRRLPYPWLVVLLLFPVALLNYLDRQMLASMKFSIMHEVSDIGSEANWGHILALFKWIYAFLSPVGGYLADRFSRRKSIVGSLFVWSAVTWATGHVTSYDGLLLTRALMGVSEAFYIPAALALIAEYHPGLTRSRAVGVHQMGIYVGVIIGGFSGYAAESASHGWRWAFEVCGLVGLLYAVPLFFLLRDPVRTAEAAAHAAESLWVSARRLLTNPSFILLVLYFTVPALAGWVVRDWMPAILKAEFGIGQGKAGVSATIYWQMAAIVGAVIGGWLADNWMRRTPRGRIYVSALGIGFTAPALFVLGLSPQTGLLWVAIAALVVFGLGWGFFDGNNMPILCQVAPPELRATGYGLMNLVSTCCGGFADWGFGAMRDAHVPLTLIFGVFAGCALLSVAFVLLIRPQPLEAVPRA